MNKYKVGDMLMYRGMTWYVDEVGYYSYKLKSIQGTQSGFMSKSFVDSSYVKVGIVKVLKKEKFYLDI